jgi:uncharacterized heparinase superfamily protein
LTSKLFLYLHTLRYLKLGQIYWRLWYKLVRACVDVSPRPNLRSVNGQWLASAHRRRSLVNADTFCFLNETGHLSELGWNGSQREKLWRYNQHYFDDLNAADADARHEWHDALVTNWIKENAPGKGTGWEPYPTSLRIVNWVKWQLSGHPLSRECLQSLAIQTRWLSRRVEWHLLGNHLFANAKALVFAGLCFEGQEAQKWLANGLNIITHELPKQVLKDGGNFELSPMYHAIFLEDLLDLINLAETYSGVIDHKDVEQWRSTAIKMLNWLETMCHPDGEITFFNDAAIGIAPSPAEIKAYSSRLAISTNHPTESSCQPALIRLADCGYVRLNAINAVAFLDVAPIGPDYLPGHAHADTLSFELSLFGERVLVNSGTSQYGSGPMRLAERGTTAHNTVVIDDENSSEVWSGFRVARRAYPQGLNIEQGKDFVSVTCAHDGYKRLHRKPVHQRSWCIRNGKLVVQDQIEGRFETAVAFFHFHPDIKVTVINHNSYALRLPNSGEEVHVFILNGAGNIEQGFFASEFGIRQESQCLAVRFEPNKDIVVEISWAINEP